jgi:hypothetical protein
MVHAIQVVLVAPARVPSFVTGMNGLYRSLAKQVARGLIDLDVLQSHAMPNAFVVTKFWISEGAYLEARASKATSVLAQFLRNLSVHCFDLGGFSFPATILSPPEDHLSYN